MCLRYLDNGLLLDDGSSSNAGHCSATSGSDAAARCHASQGPQPELSQGKYYLLCESEGWILHIDIIFNIVITGHEHAVCRRSDCSCGCRKVESS